MVRFQALLISTMAIICYAQTPDGFNPKQLTGSWEGTDDKGASAVFQFQPGGYAQVTFQGQRLVPAVPGGPSLRFKIDPSKSPMWLDFIAFDATGKEMGRIKFLLKFVGEKIIHIQASENLEIRPEKFVENAPSKTIILNKVY